MAEHGEIPAAWAGLAAAGTFVGGILAAIFGRGKPEPLGPEKGEASMAERVAVLERRMNDRAERDREERVELNEKLDLLFEKADKTQAGLAEIKGMLNARKAAR